MDRISAAGRGFSLALGLVSMVITVIGSEAKIASAESELAFDHRLADEDPSTSSRETTPTAASDSRSAATSRSQSSIEGALHQRRMFLPLTLQRFAATINLDSSVFDVLSGERGPTRSRPIGFGARTSLTRQRSLFVLNYPFEKQARSRQAPFASNAVWDMAGTPFFSGIPFERQTGPGAALLPDLFHLVSTSAFVPKSPGHTAAASFAAAHETAFVGPQSPNLYAPTLGASPVAGYEKRDWDVPARATSPYSSATPAVAATPELGAGFDASAGPVSPTLALSSGLLTSHLTFGSNGARLSGNGTIAGDIILDTSLGIAPGNSPGLFTVTGGLTWSQGGFFELEIQNTAAEPGTGWDAIHVNGILQFTATLGEPFTVHLSSLTDSGASGNISNFLASRPYALQVLTATGGIDGFNPSAVRITTTGFTNALDGGSFALLASGDNLMLTFTPVPEPSTWALMLTGASVLAVKLIRRRRRT